MFTQPCAVYIHHHTPFPLCTPNEQSICVACITVAEVDIALPTVFVYTMYLQCSSNGSMCSCVSETPGYMVPCLASFPGLLRLQFLIGCILLQWVAGWMD